jgi:hypothetical protein
VKHLLGLLSTAFVMLLLFSIAYAIGAAATRPTPRWVCVAQIDGKKQALEVTAEEIRLFDAAMTVCVEFRDHGKTKAAICNVEVVGEDK